MERVGVVAPGLTGPLCWAAAMDSPGDSVGIAIKKPPVLSQEELILQADEIEEPDTMMMPDGEHRMMDNHNNRQEHPDEFSDAEDY